MDSQENQNFTGQANRAEEPASEPHEESQGARPSGPSPEAHVVYSEADVAANKFIAALSYIGILFLVPLLLKTDSPFAQFHGKQGLVLAIVFFIGSFFFWIPVIGWAAFLVVLVVDLIALVRTLQGKAWEIPGVADVLKKLNL